MACWLVSPPTPPMASSIFIRWKDARAGDARSNNPLWNANRSERRFCILALMVAETSADRKPFCTAHGRVGVALNPSRALFEVPVDVDDQVDGGARRLANEGGQRTARVERDDGVVGPVLPRHVVDGGDGGYRLPGREEPDVRHRGRLSYGQVDRDGLRGRRDATVARHGENARL